MAKLSLRLTNYIAMKTYVGVEVQLHSFLTSALDGSEWSASQPGRFPPGKSPTLPIGYGTGWAIEPVWTRWQRKKFPTHAEN
jgi:hypothetical protein